MGRGSVRERGCPFSSLGKLDLAIIACSLVIGARRPEKTPPPDGTLDMLHREPFACRAALNAHHAALNAHRAAHPQ